MSPQPTSPTASPHPPSAAHDTEEQPHDQASSPDASHPPFEPLFALLSNTTNNATSHPRVHYIFTDDEPSILPPSNSILIDLEATPVNPFSSPASSAEKDTDKGQGETEKTNSWAIKTASSLSPNFAVTSAAVSGDGVLKIEGVSREAVSSSRQLAKSSETKRSRDGDAPHEGEDVEGLVDEFRRRMGVLRRVVEQGGKSISPLIQRDGPQDGSGEKGEGTEDKVEGS